MRKLLLASLLLLPGRALAGPPEGVSGKVVFDDMPGAFLSDVRAGRLDAAYARTSGAFQHYVSRANLPAWVKGSKEWLGRAAKLSRAKPRAGKNCREEARDLLDIGVRLGGEQDARLVFAWEDGRWQFDHIALP